MLRKRIEKLEVALTNSYYEDEAGYLRFAAYDRLEHSDRMAIVHMARKSGTGEDVEMTPEVRSVMMRWSDVIAGLRSERRQDLPSRLHRGWN